MNQNHMLAVLSAQSFNSIRPLSFSLIQAANGFLQKGEEHPMSRDQFEAAVLGLKSAEIKMGSNGIEIKPKPRKITFTGKNPHIKMANVLGDTSIRLYQAQLLKATGERVYIDFNVDGKGSTRLPNGEIVNRSLYEITCELADERDQPEIKRAREYNLQWKLCPTSHPDSANRGIRDYLKSIG